MSDAFEKLAPTSRTNVEFSRAQKKNKNFISKILNCFISSMESHHHVVEMRGVVFEEDPPFLGLILAFYPLGSMKNVFKERDLPLRTKVKVRTTTC
jgi:hypothetical protein